MAGSESLLDMIRGLNDPDDPENPEAEYFSDLRKEEDKLFISAGESTKYDIVVDYFVDTITSKYNQDVSLLLVGNKGKGKSYCGLSLCYFAACELAERLGGKWKEYFNPHTHMAIVSPKRATEVMGITSKYAVKNFDDVGLAWGARNWQQRENIEKGEVFQISRIDCQLQVFSIPNQFLLDKIPRSLVSHYAEMDQPFFDYGFTTMKLFKPLTLFREGRVIQPYLYSNRVKYVLYRVPKPPEFLTTMYNKMRKDATREAQDARLSNKPKPTGKLIKNPNAPEGIIESHKEEVEAIFADASIINKKAALVDLFENSYGFMRKRVIYWWNNGKFNKFD